MLRNLPVDEGSKLSEPYLFKDFVEQILELPSFDSHDLTIDEILSGLIYITVKSQLSDMPATLELVRNFTLTARQD